MCCCNFSLSLLTSFSVLWSFMVMSCELGAVHLDASDLTPLAEISMSMMSMSSISSMSSVTIAKSTTAAKEPAAAAAKEPTAAASIPSVGICSRLGLWVSFSLYGDKSCHNQHHNQQQGQLRTEIPF